MRVVSRPTLVFLVLLACGCGRTGNHQHSTSARPHTPTVPVLLEPIGDRHMAITITNVTGKTFTFAARLPYVIVYYRSPDGKRVPITEDASAMEIDALSPLDMICLAPGASYCMVLPVLLERRYDGDRLKLLHSPGAIYARVRGVRLGGFRPDDYPAARRAPLLDHSLFSARVATPLPITGATDRRPTLPSLGARPSPVTIRLEPVDTDRAMVTIDNGTDDPVVFSPRRTELALYHRAKGGRVTPVGAPLPATRAPRIGPCETVELEPKASYRIVLRFRANGLAHGDHRAVVGDPGALYAVARAIRPTDFVPRYIHEATKCPLLAKDLVSNEVPTPIDASLP